MTDTDPETQQRLPPNGTPTTTSVTASIPSVSQTSNSTPSAHHSIPSVHLSTSIDHPVSSANPSPSSITTTANATDPDFTWGTFSGPEMLNTIGDKTFFLFLRDLPAIPLYRN